MAQRDAAEVGVTKLNGQKIFARVGKFLDEQRLDPEPGNYAVAYSIIGQPDGPLARAAAALTDGGVRLTRRDLQNLQREAGIATGDSSKRADGLVALAQMQVDSFDDTIHAMRAETEDFSRALSSSAEALERCGGGAVTAPVEQVVQITAAMAERVRAAETKLARATEETAELRAKLEEARDNARRDPLTGLANRRAFEEGYADKLAAGEAICIAVCDIDHFKSINDRFGHAVGDRVLQAIATALSETCAGHLVARYGGEEFVVLFAGVDPPVAFATLETARTRVEAKRYRLRENDEPLGAVTFSAGLTPAETGERVQAAFQRADALLYRAKDDGRNKVIVG